MASPAGAGFAPVLAALATMQSNIDRAQKEQAHRFLEEFQKSVWLDHVSRGLNLEYLTFNNSQKPGLRHIRY